MIKWLPGGGWIAHYARLNERRRWVALIPERHRIGSGVIGMHEAERVGNFALARRNLDNGVEQVRVVTPLPVSRQRLVTLAMEHDRAELAADPNSSWRWFVVELAPEEVPRPPI